MVSKRTTIDLMVFLFAYDSMAAPEEEIWERLSGDAIYGRLSGFTRSWTLMENPDPGNPGHYVDSRGLPFAGPVAHLGLVENPFSWVNGVALPLDIDELGAIEQQRAGRYGRTPDLSALFEVKVSGPMFAYLPLDHDCDPENAVIAEVYWQACQETFSFLAVDGWQEFLLTTEISALPIRRIYSQARKDVSAPTRPRLPG